LPFSRPLPQIFDDGGRDQDRRVAFGGMNADDHRVRENPAMVGFEAVRDVMLPALVGSPGRMSNSSPAWPSCSSWFGMFESTEVLLGLVGCVGRFRLFAKKRRRPHPTPAAELSSTKIPSGIGAEC